MLREIIEGLGYIYVKVASDSEKKIVQLFQSDVEYEPLNADEFLYLGVYHVLKGNLEWAFTYYEKAGELGNINGFYNVGCLYTNIRNYEKAKFYYEKAIELGHISSLVHLGDIYNDVWKVEDNAIYYYEKAADLGKLSAMFKLGTLYETRGDYEKAIIYFEKAADQDHPESINNLGHLYEQIADYNNARFNYKRAADLGHMYAMNNLACLYKNIDRDYEQAEIFFIKSVNLGNPIAMRNLAHFYYDIKGDCEKALFYYKQAADLNIIGAMYDAGNLLFDKDPIQSEFYYKKASNAGQNKSTIKLFEIYKNQKRHEEAFLLAHKYQLVLGEDILLSTLSHLTYPISDQNKDQIYTTLETFNLPKGLTVTSDIFYIMQDVVSRKVKVLCDIAFYYKKYNK